MKNHHFYFWSNLELTEYYNLDIIPENTRLIRYRSTDKSSNDNIYNSETKIGITFALGLIVTLIILGGAQLYNAVKATPATLDNHKNQINSIKLDDRFNSIPTKK